MSAVHSPQMDVILNNSVRSSLNSSSPSAIANRRVCRNLFGHPDPRSSSYARDKVKEIQQQQNEKWNFDFDNEIPQSGRFKWEPVAVESSSTSSENQLPVPKAYACQRLPFIAAASSSTITSNVTSNFSHSATNVESGSLYYTPTPLTNKSCSSTSSSSDADREPLLIVRPSPATTTNLSGDSLTTAGFSTVQPTIQQQQEKFNKDQSIKTTSKIANDDSFISPPPINNNNSLESKSSSSSSSHPKSLSTPDDIPLQSEEATVEESIVNNKNLGQVNVQVKSRKQPTIPDFMMVRKRKASPQTTSTGKKKAAK